MPEFDLSAALRDPVMFAYHVTMREFLPSIRRKGLQPRPHEHSPDEPCIFVERDQQEAEVYAEENSITLRFPVEGFGTTEDGEDIVYEAVNAADIEYFDRGRWLKLKA